MGNSSAKNTQCGGNLVAGSKNPKSLYIDVLSYSNPTQMQKLALVTIYGEHNFQC